MNVRDPRLVDLSSSMSDESAAPADGSTELDGAASERDGAEVDDKGRKRLTVRDPGFFDLSQFTAEELVAAARESAAELAEADRIAAPLFALQTAEAELDAEGAIDPEVDDNTPIWEPDPTPLTPHQVEQARERTRWEQGRPRFARFVREAGLGAPKSSCAYSPDIDFVALFARCGLELREVVLEDFMFGPRTALEWGIGRYWAVVEWTGDCYGYTTHFRVGFRGADFSGCEVHAACPGICDPEPSSSIPQRALEITFYWDDNEMSISSLMGLDDEGELPETISLWEIEWVADPEVETMVREAWPSYQGEADVFAACPRERVDSNSPFMQGVIEGFVRWLAAKTASV